MGKISIQYFFDQLHSYTMSFGIRRAKYEHMHQCFAHRFVAQAQ